MNVLVQLIQFKITSKYFTLTLLECRKETHYWRIWSSQSASFLNLQVNCGTQQNLLALQHLVQDSLQWILGSWSVFVTSLALAFVNVCCAVVLSFKNDWWWAKVKRSNFLERMKFSNSVHSLKNNCNFVIFQILFRIPKNPEIFLDEGRCQLHIPHIIIKKIIK